MKKLFALTLSVLLAAALLLTGCGSPDSAETTAPGSVPTEAETAAPTGAPTQPATEAPTEVPTDDLTPTLLGTIDGNVYENNYVGFGCEFPETWTIASAETLQELPAAIDEMLADTDLDNTLPQIMDLYAQDSSANISVNVLYTQLPPAERLAYMLMDEDAIVEALLAQKDMLEKTYTQMGMEVVSIEKDTVKFLDEDHTVMHTVCSSGGTEAHIMQVFHYNLGGKYGVTTSFSGLTSEAVENAMALFYGLE